MRAAAWLPWGVAAAALVVAAWSLLRPAAPPAESPAFKTALPIERPAVGGGTLDISRDGSTLVVGGADSLLRVRRSNDTTFRPIPGTEGATSAMISPDGAWIAFTRGRTLMKVQLAGGPVLPIADSVQSAQWYAPDSIVYSTYFELRIIGAGGGVARPIPAADTKNGGLRFPFMLPDHESLLYQGPGGVEWLDLRTGRHTLLEPGGTNPRYVPTGEILFGDADRQAVFAVPFDVRSHAITGTPVPVLDSVGISVGGNAQFAVSDNGTLFYVPSDAIRAPGGRLIWVDTTGAITTPALATSRASLPRVSHDGTRISYQETGRGTFVYNLTTGATPQVDSSASGIPFWSPSDSELYLSHPRFGWRRVAAEPRGASVSLGAAFGGPMEAISADGAWIVIVYLNSTTAPDLFIARTDSLPLRPKPYLDAPYREDQPAVSPDAHWMAYVSNETGNDEVYIRSFPVPGSATKVSSGGGAAPMWAPQGSMLYYVSRGNMYRATLRLGATVSVLANRPFFPWPRNAEVVRKGIQREVDLSPDGKRFITTMAEQGTRASGSESRLSTAFVIVNWFSELKAAMGAARR